MSVENYYEQEMNPVNVVKALVQTHGIAFAMNVTEDEAESVLKEADIISRIPDYILDGVDDSTKKRIISNMIKPPYSVLGEVYSR